MAWKKVFDDEHLLSAKEYKIAEKFVEKSERKEALFIKRGLIHTSNKYTIYSGVICHNEWDEFANFTEPAKYFFIIDKNTNKVIAFTKKLNQSADSIIYILKNPFKIKDIVCTDATNKNAIFNISTENIIPVDTTLKYDEQNNIYTQETINVTKKTYYKDGTAQSPIYSGHEEIIR